METFTDRDSWESHWTEYADSAEENPAQAYRRKMIFKHLTPSDGVLGFLAYGEGQEMKVLDVGSGQGDLLRDVHARFPAAETLGVELSRSGIESAVQKLPKGRFVQRNLLDSAPVDADVRGWATHAVCSEVLEHVEQPEVLLRNASEFMAPGCRLVVTVPGGPMSYFDRHIGHRRHFTARTLRGVLEAAGLEVDRIYRTGFPFFNLYRLTVIVRGKSLVADVSNQTDSAMSRLASFVMSVFRFLFRFNLNDAPGGWQLVAVARKSNPSLPKGESAL